MQVCGIWHASKFATKIEFDEPSSTFGPVQGCVYSFVIILCVCGIDVSRKSAKLTGKNPEKSAKNEINKEMTGVCDDCNAKKFAILFQEY